MKIISEKIAPQLTLGVGLLLMWALRLWQQQFYELDVDTSAWISSAISAARSETPLWTLLNYSDSRPLTVFPLFVLEKIGVAVTWSMAEKVGLVLWAFSIVFFYATLRRWFSPWQSLFFSLPLLIFQASNAWFGFMAYNSEAVCVFMLTVGLWLVTGLEKNKNSIFAYFFVGFWLGLLPFAKMQTVPMGLVLGLWACSIAFQQRRYGRLLVLLVAASLPTIFLNGFYWQKGEWEVFWSDYFWNYYYYSFTQIHSAVPLEDRFSLLFLIQFFYQNSTTRLFWGASFVLLLIGFIKWIKTAPFAPPRSVVWGVLALLSASMYAILQAGNLFSHYLLLLLVPINLLLVLLLQSFQWRVFSRIWLCFLLLIGAEGIKNAVQYPVIAVPQPFPNDKKIIQAIKKYSKPTDKMTIWGYADRFFVHTRLTAGNRLPHSYWIYMPSPMQSYRQKQFLEDLAQNQPALFIDAFTEKVSLVYGLDERKYRHDNFPDIATYINAHYQQVEEIGKVRIYRKIK